MHRGHYVLVRGKTADGDYLIIDPGHRNNTNLTHAYGNSFRLRGYVIDPPGDLSGLNLGVGGNAELILIDPSGRQTGFAPATGTFLNGIPQSAHATDQIDADGDGQGTTEAFHSIQVRQPAQGTYKVVVSGTKSGSYTLRINGFSQDGSAQPGILMPGIVGVDSTSSFQIQFVPSPGSTPQVIRVATFQSTLDDINNSLQLGLIDNQGIADSLSSKINAAANAAARGQTQTSRNNLNAFKNEVNAQAGKHVMGIAVQVLLEDADSLIRRIH